MLTEVLARPADAPFPRYALSDGSAGQDVLAEEDLQVALWTCYELSYQGFEHVDPSWEDSLPLMRLRHALEHRLETGLRDLVHPMLPAGTTAPAEVPEALTGLVENDPGPGLSGFLQREASVEQFREFVVHRSIYHLKEADPHSFALPRLPSPVKAALVEIQADEYGGGHPQRMHSELFRTLMRALDLDDAYGAYVDQVPAATLAVSNMMSLFALHRRLLGALLGQLAVFEMTSSLPNRRYGTGLRRLGYSPAAARYYDEHVQADAVHEQIAAHDLCGGFARHYPEQTGTVLFGAAAGLAVEAHWATQVLAHWAAGRSALRDRAAVAAA
ncbi:iron-containing redox enzyme family protein [Amycolatopsis sp. lyj-23]|uniref:iron-containing redox enzyme family protein n=1 Tax=Amycolatopsis sp. lyj-23 TaxID=2789283 RepID=UPI00397910DE